MREHRHLEQGVITFTSIYISPHPPDCRVCQRRTREFLNKKILAHLGAVYSKVYTLFWPKTLYLHCILQGFYHFSFFGWLFKRTYKYFCAPAPQCFAFVHPRSRRKVPYSAVWLTLSSPQLKYSNFLSSQCPYQHSSKSPSIRVS